MSDVDPRLIDGDDARIAFWLNLYNAHLLYALRVRPRSGHLIRHVRMFDKQGPEIGGARYSLNFIEHALLRRNRRPPYRPTRCAKPGDPRLEGAPSRLDPRVHFALNCGARSCPPIQAYSAEGLNRELDRGTRAYFAGECELDREGNEISLPGLCRLYRRDFGDRAAQLEFAARHLAADDGSWVSENADRLRVRYSRYDWGMVPFSDLGEPARAERIQ